MSVTAPSWEEIVNQVTIAGDYSKVRQAAQHWQAAFTRMSELRDAIRDLSRQSESWRGGGGNAFRDHLAALIQALDKTVQEHERIARGLDECARHLETAVRKIPIPSWMYNEVLRKRQDYATNQALDGVRPNEFWTSWVSGLRANPDTSWVEQTLRAGEEYFANWQETAQQAYMELRQAYARDLAGMPTGTRAAVPGVDENAPWRNILLGAASAVLDHVLSDRQGQPPTAGRPGGLPPGTPVGTPPFVPGPTVPPPGGMPGGGFPGGGFPGGIGGPGGFPGGGVPGVDYPGFDYPGYPGTDLPGFDPDGPTRPTTGLESGGRFGGGGGGSVSAAGFPAGGMSPIGPPVSVPVTDATGPAAASARGPAGGGAGMGGMGMMGMGGAGAGADDRVGSDTWLKEDEDFFGPDTSAASGILDA